MASQNLDSAVHSPLERTGSAASISFSRGVPVQDYRKEQTQQSSGVLIDLFKKTSKHDSCTTSKHDNRLIKDTSCWTCRRLIACLSKALGGRESFALGSSNSNCPLKHELLIAVRVFLKQHNLYPDIIRIETQNNDPLRLILKKKRPVAEKINKTQSKQPARQKTDLSTWSSSSYDLYQENEAKQISIRGVWIPKAASIPKSSRSTECLMRAKAWLNNCLQQHPQCRNQNHTVTELPHRVIDVTIGQLRLVVPKKGTRGHWVALSHCWGKTNTFKTMLDTLEVHQCGIDWDELPRTFKDAILVTRAINVQYLWIDSLCIIQDDGGIDFHTEAAKMCDIYRNSILTIAASCSASDCAGFLQDRAIENFRLEKPQRLSSIRFRQTIHHSGMLRDDPIHTRAWTFQETILPRRLLSFGSCEASWECETLRQCECGQIERGDEGRITSNELGRAAYRKYTNAVIQGKFHLRKHHDLSRLDAHSSIREIYTRHVLAEAPEPQDQDAYREYVDKVRRMTMNDVLNTVEFASPDTKALIFSGQQYVEFGEIDPKDVPECAESLESTFRNDLAIDAFYRYWRRVLVPEYTRRALSKDTDRLVALQAISSDICAGIQDRYLAGLWEGDLFNQLCWQSVDGQCLPADNESPSWSWSSIRGPIIPFMPEELEKVLNRTGKTTASRNLADLETEDEEITNKDMEGEEMTDDSASDVTDCDSISENMIYEGRNDKTGKTYDLNPMCIYSAECSLASKNPCGRILDGSITLIASALKVHVRFHETSRKGRFRFHAQIRKVGDLGPATYVPLNIDFRPDAPLGSHSDGSLARCAQSDVDFPNTGLSNHALTAIILFVEGYSRHDFCVLVCGIVSVTAESITCRRLGIGTFKRVEMRSCCPNITRERFVLI